MKLNRGDKIFLDQENKKESEVNHYLDCRDGIVKMYEYRDNSGYGSQTRLFYCQDTKHETVCIIRQVYIDHVKEWIEQSMIFDSDSFEFLKGLLNGTENLLGGQYFLVRDY